MPIPERLEAEDASEIEVAVRTKMLCLFGGGERGLGKGIPRENCAETKRRGRTTGCS